VHQRANGDSVLVIDRVLRLHTLKDIDGYHIGDFADSASLATIYDYNPDVIVHCAGTSLVGPSMADPGLYYDNNIAKTVKLLNFIKDFKKKPIILFSSSASVYGEPDQLPIKETARIQPISPYGNTKAMTETILRDYWGAYALPSTVFRYFNAAGAEPVDSDLGQEPNATHIVARVLEASIAGQAFAINGEDFDTPDGTCIRDYVHVWDIAQAHVLAADRHFRYAGSVHRCYNLGTNNGVSNKQIVDYVAETYGLPFVNYGPKRMGDPARLVADAELAQVELGWHPEYSDINTIIDSAYKWYTRV
jgi:UDP-glucose 4-epimerase